MPAATTWAAHRDRQTMAWEPSRTAARDQTHQRKWVIGGAVLHVLDFYDTFAIRLAPGSPPAAGVGSAWAGDAGSAVHAVVQAASIIDIGSPSREAADSLSWNVVFCHERCAIIYLSLIHI